MKRLITALMLILLNVAAFSQDLQGQFIEIDLAREYGLFSKSPAVLRAVSIASTKSRPKQAMLFFPGWPGIMWIPENFQPERMVQNSSKSKFFVTKNLELFAAQEIVLVMIDCPTDEWGSSTRTRDPMGCGDSYRSSQRHADDIRKLIRHLRERQGVEKFYVMGHSYGTISSRWLAANLGNEIEGSIHSASLTHLSAPQNPRLTDYGNSLPRFSNDLISQPYLYIHNDQDQCHSNQYPSIQKIVPDRLITVKGGIAEGDPCGGGHLHSFQGREVEALNAILKWVNTREITPVVGE
jgi:hypothetical protein